MKPHPIGIALVLSAFTQMAVMLALGLVAPALDLGHLALAAALLVIAIHAAIYRAAPLYR